MKVTVIPIVIGAFGTVTKGLVQGLGNLEIRRMETFQTAALLRSARILRSVLEAWGDLLSLRLKWKTINLRWCENYYVLAKPIDNNISVKEYYKISKYKDLEIEIEIMLHLKTTIVSIIMGTLGMIKKRTDKHTSTIPGRPRLYKIHNIALCGPAHLLKEVLSI